LDWRSFGLLFSFPFLAIRSFFVGITHTKALSWSAVTAVAINIPLNYFLIFTLELGISGAAIASSLAEMDSLIVLCIYTGAKIDKEKYGLKPVYDGRLLFKVLNLSVWSMLHAFISVAPWFLFFVAIEHLGKTELAISNITRSVSAIFFVIANSFAVTTGSLVSNAIGAGARKELFPICHKVLKLGYAVGFPLVVVALLCNRWIVSFYTDNELLVELAFAPFVVMLLNYTFALPGYVYLNAVGGTGKTKITFLFQVTTTCVYLVYLYWLSFCIEASLSLYLTAEYLFVILLALQSIIYLKSKHY
jgi:Na+-driven multidrug efflux pump